MASRMKGEKEMIRWRWVALSVVVLLGVSFGCGGGDEPAAEAQPAAGKTPATQSQAAPALDPQQVEAYLAKFSWDPAKGAERDKTADSQECQEQVGELSKARSGAMIQVKQHIDCMKAKGWTYSR
jgi:hypothetical protein